MPSRIPPGPRLRSCFLERLKHCRFRLTDLLQKVVFQMKHIMSLISNKETSASGRMEFLDFWRGLAMLLVLLQHANAPGGGWILSFHMPLFFLLSGYLASFREQKATFWTYIKPKFFRLLLPYFFLKASICFCGSYIKHNLVSGRMWRILCYPFFYVRTDIIPVSMDAFGFGPACLYVSFISIGFESGQRKTKGFYGL